MKRIAVDLAKSVYQVAENVQVGRVDRRKRLDSGGFARYVQEQIETVECVMEAFGTAHHWACGRHLSAWLGMTPSEYSSGELGGSAARATSTCAPC